MRIEELDLKDLFTKKQKCDFCESPDAYIARLTVHPMVKFDRKNEMSIFGVIIAKKCWKCCEE